MLKTFKKLLKDLSFKGKGLFAAFAIASLPLNVLQPSLIFPQGQAQALLIPENKLDVAFNIQASSSIKSNEAEIQIPIKFIYMSQGFHTFHPGIDLATDYGTKILPIETGIVEEAGFSPFGYGNMILIDHGNGLESLYAHLSKIEVKKGEEVDMATEIGLVGVTGHSTGPHLHLEIHKNGVPINPLVILPPLNSNTLRSKLLSSN